MINNKIRLLLILCVLLGCSCVKQMDLYQDVVDDKKDVNREDFFDFCTTGEYSVNLDFGYPCDIIFYLYDTYPYELIDDSWEMNPTVEPIYAGCTNENGVFNKKITLSAFYNKLWLVADHLLLDSHIELSVAKNTIQFNKEEYVAGNLSKTRATMSGIIYPDGYDILGEWSDNGIPSYLLTEKIDIPSAFLKRCNNLASSIIMDTNNPLLDKYPELQTNGTNDMVITKPTALVATYFKSTASWENMVAYYTYHDGESIDINDLQSIKKTLLFPRYSSSMPSSLIGEQVQLMYWNKETNQYEETFPVGTHIGWILLGRGWNNTKATLRYSNPAFNSDSKQRSVLLSDPELDNCFFMGMEDNIDARFNDVNFAVIAAQSNSIEATPTIPDEVAKSEVYYKVYGSLAYEDNWPYKGDYDMNDLVVNFSSTVAKHTADNKITRITTTFTPVNNGASYTNGFAFQLDNIAQRQVTSLTVSSGGNIVSESFEEGTNKPVVVLFNDVRAYLNKPITVVMEFNRYTNGGVTEEDALPPFNPFVFSRDRSREIHLAGYLPTSKVDENLRGTGDDVCQDSNGHAMYYISSDNMPFGLYISGAYFDYPDEKQHIYDKYPFFINWVNSFGQEYQDWYLR